MQSGFDKWPFQGGFHMDNIIAGLQAASNDLLKIIVIR
jgi:hypothetical protein